MFIINSSIWILNTVPHFILTYFFLLLSAQANVRALGLPFRPPVTVPATSPTYPSPFPASFLTSSSAAPLFYQPNYWSNCAGYWSNPYLNSAAAAGAPPPAANGAAHHPEGAPLYSLAVSVPHRLTEVPSSGDSRGSAEYGSRDDGSDKEGPSQPQGLSTSRSPPQQKGQPRFQPYDRASGSSKKRHFEDSVSICEGEVFILVFLLSYSFMICCIFNHWKVFDSNYTWKLPNVTGHYSLILNEQNNII